MKEIIFVHKLKLNKGKLNREVTLRIMLPKSYAFTNKNYPVLYMMDGQNLYYESESSYGGCWRFVDSYKNLKLPELIVVGIDSAPGYQSLNEFSPWEFKYQNDYYGGHAREFVDWIVESVKPWIDKKYRTLPDFEYTAIGGSGMGGVLATFAITNYPNTFSRAATLSNAYWTVFDNVLDNIKKSKLDHIKYWYTYVGTNEVSNSKLYKEPNDKVYKLLVKKGLEKRVKYKVTEGGTHHETSWAQVVPSFINYIFQDLK